MGYMDILRILRLQCNACKYDTVFIYYLIVLLYGSANNTELLLNFTFLRWDVD